MLTNKQKKYLKSLAHTRPSLFQIGKGGINDHLIVHIQEAIEFRELIKVSILKNNSEDPHDIGEQLAHQSGCELVQVIGRTIVLYKKSQEHQQIQL